MATAILRILLSIVGGGFVGVAGISLWIAATSELAMLVHMAALVALFAILCAVACVLAWLAVMMSEN